MTGDTKATAEAVFRQVGGLTDGAGFGAQQASFTGEADG